MHFNNCKTFLLGVSAITGAALHGVIVNDGSALVIDEGVHLVAAGAHNSFMQEGAARLRLDGTLKLTGDFEDHTGEPIENYSFGPFSQVIFNGTEQEIFATNGVLFRKLSIENGSNVHLASGLAIESVLNLERGILHLGDSDLDLVQGVTIGGRHGLNAMVATDGAGVVRQYVAVSGILSFPVGTVGGSGPAFTPVVVDLVEGEFTEGAFVEARSVFSSFEENASLVDYINRYWVLDQAGIGNMHASASFWWGATDERGNVENLFGGLFDGSEWLLLDYVDPASRMFTASVTDFGTFTAGERRAFYDDIIAENGPGGLTEEENVTENGIDLGKVFKAQPSLAYHLDHVQRPELFESVRIEGDILKVNFAPGAVGESTMTISVTNEYGVTREKTFYVTIQPDPQPDAGRLNHITGLYEQVVTLQNISEVRALDVGDLLITSLPEGTTLYRATLLESGQALYLGETAGRGEMIVDHFLHPGETAEVLLEYVSRSRQMPDGLSFKYGQKGYWDAAMESAAEGWYVRAPLGYMYVHPSRWFFHYGLGWAYMGSRDVHNTWIWSYELGWLWTGADFFPWFYSIDSDGWLYHAPGSFPGWFYDLNTRNWIQL